MADIIVQDITPRVQQVAGAGNPTVFYYPFPVFALTDVVVYYTPVNTLANDVANILVYNIGYTVTNNVAPAVGGYITLTTPANTGDIITIVRATPDQFLDNFVDGGLFEATQVNASFDENVMMVQQNTMYNQVLGLHYNNSAIINSPLTDNVLPVLPAGTFWMKNSANTQIIAATVASLGGIVIQLPVFPGQIPQFINAQGGLGASIYSFPAVDGSNGDSLTTNGAGQLQTTTIPGLNRLINGDFQVWQRGAGGSASFSLAGNTNAYTADRWQTLAPVGGAMTVTQQAGPTSGSYYAQVQRNAGQAGVLSPVFGQTLTRSMCIGAAGKQLTLSFNALCGANFSAAANLLNFHIVTGTGTTDVSAFTTGFTGTNTIASNGVNLTTAVQSFTLTVAAIPANITQLAIYFSWTPVGIAGANDWFQVTDVQLEVSATKSPFQRFSFPDQVMKCLAFFRKSFNYVIAPAQNVGAASHEMLFAATIAGSNGNVISKIIFEPPMIAAPNVTYYNPAAANALIRDITGAVDFATTTTQNADTGGITIIGTGNADTAAGDLCGIHYTLDADLT